MAYQTGTFNSPAALKSAVEAFATANGWALAGGVLSQGASYVRLTTPDASTVLIEGCNDSSFTAPQLCPQAARIRITTWPAIATYHLFALTTPDVIWCTINYATTAHQYLAFGDVAKAGSWTGGNWFAASHNTGAGQDDLFLMSPTGSGPLGYYYYSGVLFWGQNNHDGWNGGYANGRSAHLHCELNGTLWPGSATEADHPTFPLMANPLHRRIVSTADDEQVLLPYWLGLRRPDGYYSDLGHIEHLRCARLLNHAPGDILDYAGEQWMVFPWYARDEVRPDGGNDGSLSTSTRGTGLWGYAVRYDGP